MSNRRSRKRPPIPGMPGLELSPYFDLFRTVKISMSIQDWHRLPRNGSYKYEYLEGVAWLTPRPDTMSARLRLTDRPDVREVGLYRFREQPLEVRPLTAGRWKVAADLFRGAFRLQQPFLALGDPAARRAAHEVIAHTRRGGDGELIPGACLIGYSRERSPARPRACCGILVTRIPDLRVPGAYRPHLTWIFTHPFVRRRGLATRLLGHAIDALSRAGEEWLLSSFLTGDTSSALWHWRNGFVLDPLRD